MPCVVTVKRQLCCGGESAVARAGSARGRRDGPAARGRGALTHTGGGVGGRAGRTPVDPAPAAGHLTRLRRQAFEPLLELLRACC